MLWAFGPAKVLAADKMAVSELSDCLEGALLSLPVLIEPIRHSLAAADYAGSLQKTQIKQQFPRKPAVEILFCDAVAVL